MKFLLSNIVTLFHIFLLLSLANGMEEKKKDVYIVYMGAAPLASSPETLTQTHLELLTSVIKRQEQVKLIHSYKYGFSGFAAKLSKEEALAISQKQGVVSVFVDPIYQLHTTRSWDFLQLQNSLETSLTPGANEGDAGSSSTGAEDTIIGLLDTGIWPESPSFSDKGMKPLKKRWNGTCVKADDFNSSNCNMKLIGARSYATDDSSPFPLTSTNSPRDEDGHGTHTASTAAGSAVSDASYYGVATGTAKGGSPNSRIAMYKVCGDFGCSGSSILAAFDDAIADGVDVLSISLGASAFFRPDFNTDPIAIGSFHAVEKNVMVVCSAGNDGPSAESVVNAAPWILTVAATTIDRKFESDIALGGNNDAIKGEAINFSILDKSPMYPLIYGESAKSNSNSSTDQSASHCEVESLDLKKIKGKIVVCKHSEDDTSKSIIVDQLKDSGAIGVILVNDQLKSIASAYLDFPVTEILLQAAEELFTYINSTKKPVATILPTIAVTNYKPAPQIAYFSSRGPSSQTKNILKPDIAAPGVNILAGWPLSNLSSNVPPGQKPSGFNLLSGTSMSCPHVAGVAANVKSWNPNWSPAAIRSAIMTTAILMNNNKTQLTTDSGSIATPYDFGAGEVNPTAALQPGLIYDAGPEDYLLFLCNYGYNTTTIKAISNSTLAGFECPKNSSKDLISNLNYPSIAISNLQGQEKKTVSRALTNVGAEEITYTVSVQSPVGVDVKVVPEKLQFTKKNKKLTYQVTFSIKDSLTSELFGWITWSNGKQRVRSPYVISSK
ncbi:Tripeptidyl-peptidase II protein [Dioscorea alata]|uniref:Tripeptidyl-peptidase II protein n=2 Tax=Dioscorea alata TaxID=55571 RepID=A0ACB7V635_DIOAL|nr:Tripeptidyl-peptidase II protein [Dioscorea alata]